MAIDFNGRSFKSDPFHRFTSGTDQRIYSKTLAAQKPLHFNE
jgi:hypothetical protein